MSSFAAARCQHIKVSGTQCGSPALRSKKFCFYHQEHRPWPVECYADDKYATGTITLPYFEDAHSIQSVIRQVVQMVLQKRIERKTASLPALRAPDRLFESQAYGTRKTAARAGCHQSRNGIGNSHGCRY